MNEPRATAADRAMKWNLFYCKRSVVATTAGLSDGKMNGRRLPVRATTGLAFSRQHPLHFAVAYRWRTGFASVVLVGLAVGVTGCAHGPRAPECLDGEAAARALAEAERQVDASAAESVRNAVSEEIEESCFKRKYLRSGQRIVLYKRPIDSADAVRTVLAPDRPKGVAPDACLADVERSFEKLRISHVTLLLARVRSREEWRWLDPDIGPSKWLDCTPHRTSQYYEQLETLAHELNRDAREGNCLFVAAERTRRCFSLPEHLPPARSARLALSFDDRLRQEAVDRFLDLYLGPESTATFLTLLDELNAHTLATEVRIAVFERIGKSAIYGDRGSRNLSYLSLFLAQTAHYLAKLKETDPALFADVFGKSKETHANVWALFERGEQTFDAWRKLAHGTRDSATRVESELWSLYRKIKAKL